MEGEGGSHNGREEGWMTTVSGGNTVLAWLYFIYLFLGGGKDLLYSSGTG